MPDLWRGTEAEWKSERDGRIVAEAENKRLRERVTALLDDEDDPYVHVHPDGLGEPDCAACWVADLRAALATGDEVRDA